jgi:hypothetical protein
MKGNFIMFDPAATHYTLINRLCELGMISLAFAPLFTFAALFAH